MKSKIKFLSLLIACIAIIFQCSYGTTTAITTTTSLTGGKTVTGVFVSAKSWEGEEEYTFEKEDGSQIIFKRILSNSEFIEEPLEFAFYDDENMITNPDLVGVSFEINYRVEADCYNVENIKQDCNRINSIKKLDIPQKMNNSSTIKTMKLEYLDGMANDEIAAFVFETEDGEKLKFCRYVNSPDEPKLKVSLIGEDGVSANPKYKELIFQVTFKEIVVEGIACNQILEIASLETMEEVDLDGETGTEIVGVLPYDYIGGVWIEISTGQLFRIDLTDGNSNQGKNTWTELGSGIDGEEKSSFVFILSDDCAKSKKQSNDNQGRMLSIFAGEIIVCYEVAGFSMEDGTTKLKMVNTKDKIQYIFTSVND